MIGYVQNARVDQVLNEVNQAVTARRMPRIVLSRHGWQRSDVSTLHHRLDRAVQPTPFDLWHSWLDLVNQSDN
jgi:hypothetical protein